MLQMKTSLIHSASSFSFKLHVLLGLPRIAHKIPDLSICYYKSLRAPQICSYDSRSFYLLLIILYLSNVVLGGLLKAASSRDQNSVKEIAKISLKTLFPSLPRARNKIERIFLSASVRLIPLNFLFSSLIRFSSAASYCFIAFLFLVSLLSLSVSDLLPVTYSRMGICFSGASGPCRLSMSRFFFAIIAN